jgi:hypothetical protein
VETHIYKLGRKAKNNVVKRYQIRLKNTKINNWTKRTQDRVKWKEVAEKARTLKNEILPPG